jgi:hypothetical protein
MPIDALDPAPGAVHGPACRVPDAARVTWTSLDDDETRVLRDALASGLWTAGAPARWAKRERRSYTFVGELATGRGPRAVVVKRVPEPLGPVGAIRRATGRTKALRQVHGAVRLARIGVRASAPLLVLRGEEEGRWYEWLVLGALPGQDVLRALAGGALDHAGVRAVAERVGRVVETITRAGLFNRDHKLSNQILLPDGSIGVIDTVDVRSGGGAASVEKMLLTMLREARGVGALPGLVAMARCVRAAAGSGWRTQLRRLSALESKMGDTTPAVDPLADAD